MRIPDEAGWAWEEFGHCAMTDLRNRDRLVQIAAGVLRAPSARIAEAFPDAADAEATYDWVGCPRVQTPDLIDAMGVAAARRATGAAWLWAATDGTALSLTRTAQRRATGPLGTRAQKGRGLKLMDTVLLDAVGVPLGLIDLQVWARPNRRPVPHKRRTVDQKETRYWLAARAATRARLRANAPHARVGFLHDRDGDSWPVLLDMLDHDAANEVTIVRASWDRRAWPGHDADAATTHALGHLRALLAAQPRATTHAVAVTATPTRAARRAWLDVRFAAVTLDLRCVPGGGHRAAPVWAVWAREGATTPAGEDPLEWLLLTTYPVTTPADACFVLEGYTFRWRGEDFHAVLKDGVLHAARMAVATRPALEHWTCVLCAIAMRLLRITHLARAAPETPARAELDADELHALRDLRAAHGRSTPDAPTMGELIFMLAGLGGSVRSRRYWPGPRVLGRGLERVMAAADVYRGQRRRRSARNDGDS
jgi:hypothetical protein